MKTPSSTPKAKKITLTHKIKATSCTDTKITFFKKNAQLAKIERPKRLIKNHSENDLERHAASNSDSNSDRAQTEGNANFASLINRTFAIDEYDELDKLDGLFGQFAIIDDDDEHDKEAITTTTRQSKA